MTVREAPEREIYQLTAIIKADAEALRKKTTPDSDRALLLRQIEIRTAKRDRLRAQLQKTACVPEDVATLLRCR